MSATCLSQISDKEFTFDGRPICFFQARDEILRLPAFYSHYRALGFTRFVAIDHESSDGTKEFLLEQTDTTVYSGRGNYIHNREIWQNALLDRYGIGRWCLTVDCDELFVYHCAETRSISELCDYLERRGARAVIAPLVDFYSALSIEETAYKPGTPFLSTCPYFDGNFYQYKPLTRCPWISVAGGVRQRVFFPGEDGPELIKVPLVKWQTDVRYTSPHHLTDTPISSLRGALLHFKFFHDFSSRVRHAVETLNHWNFSSEYCHYFSVLKRHPHLNLFLEAQSVCYESTVSIQRLGLCNAERGWR